MKSILFIDDEKDFFPIVQRLFSKENYRIVCAQDGQEGLLKCRNEEFDLIISDYRMPKVDGLRFYTQIRDWEEARNLDRTPILFVSAWSDEVKAKKRDWEECDFLNKPFQVYELLGKATKLLGVKGSSAAPKTEGKIFLNPSDILFDEGDVGQELYYLASGELHAFKDTGEGQIKLVGKFFSGDIIGEIPLIDEAPHAYRVVAQESSEIIVIHHEKIQAMIKTQPKWIKLMLESLTKQLRQSLKLID